MIDYQMETVRATATAQAERPITTLHTHTHSHSQSQSLAHTRSRLQAPPAGAHEPAAVLGLSQPTQSFGEKKKFHYLFAR